MIDLVLCAAVGFFGLAAVAALLAYRGAMRHVAVVRRENSRLAAALMAERVAALSRPQPGRAWRN